MVVTALVDVNLDNFDNLDYSFNSDDRERDSDVDVDVGVDEVAAV